MRVAAVILLLINLGLSGAQQCNEKFNIPKFSFDGYKFKCEVKMVYDDIEFDYERYLSNFYLFNLTSMSLSTNLLVARSKMYECKTKAPVGTNPTGDSNIISFECCRYINFCHRGIGVHTLWLSLGSRPCCGSR